jgi:hypothetical protein
MNEDSNVYGIGMGEGGKDRRLHALYIKKGTPF